MIPTIYIYGAFGDRAAVLVKYPKAKAIRTSRMGERFPIYEIVSGKTVLGCGHGSTDAWHQTAEELWKTHAKG